MNCVAETTLIDVNASPPAAHLFCMSPSCVPAAARLALARSEPTDPAIGCATSECCEELGRLPCCGSMDIVLLCVE